VGAPAAEEGRAVVREVAAALEAAYRLSVPPDPLARDRKEPNSSQVSPQEPSLCVLTLAAAVARRAEDRMSTQFPHPIDVGYFRERMLRAGCKRGFEPTDRPQEPFRRFEVLWGAVVE